MSDIEDSVMQIFPNEPFSQNVPEEVKVYLDTPDTLSDMFQTTQTTFWVKSLLITAIITLLGSSLIYLIVGYALRPLQQLGTQMQEIQAKNLRQPISLKNSSVEITRLTDAFNAMLARLGDAFLHRDSSLRMPHTSFVLRLLSCRQN